MHKNTRYNIVQTRNNSNEWSIIDGQRLPSGAPETGARAVVAGLTREDAIFWADVLQTEADLNVK